MSGLDLDLLADEVASLLQPITDGIDNPGALSDLLGVIGLENGGDAALVSSLTAVADFARQCRTLADQSEPSFEAVMALLEKSRGAFVALSTLTDAGGAVDGLTSLGEDLAQVLMGAWLADRYPVARDAAILLGLMTPRWEQALQPGRASNGKVVRYPYAVDRFHAGRLIDLVKDPVAALRAEYASPMATDADAAALTDKLFPRLQMLLGALGIASRYGIDDADAAGLGAWAAPMAHTLAVYFDRAVGGGRADAGVVLSLSPASQGDLGLVIAPFGTLTFSRRAGRWNLDANVTAGLDVLAWGRKGPTFLAAKGTAEVGATLTGTIGAPVDGSPAQVFGAPNGTRLEIGGVKLGVETHLSSTHSSLAVAADVTKARLVLSGGDGDGFTSSMMPSDGLRGDFDLGIGWSTDKGLTLRGSAGLEATFPVGQSLAGVTLTSVHLGLRAKDAQVEGEISASFSASIGPIQAAVERIGLATVLTFPDKGGNLGVADLKVGFKPPTGAGLAIDAHGVLTGGGFLALDPDTGNYGGVVQLSLHEKISLAGYGLIATKMPDGRPGFSLLVFITADGFKPIPLGFGFMLQSIGGMLGIHRTFDVDVLRSGLKSDNLATLLFPRDPVGQAPMLLAALAAAFPVRQGSYLIGLLARITWFTPTLVQLDLALILELGARTRLLALGRISALLPSRQNDLVRINLDSMGVLDFDAGTFDADAVLVDSRIAHQFPVTGSAALRARWPSAGASASFVMAVGGFNPRFAPPSGFPQLDRVAIALCAGKNPRLICEAYFAITSNTVQFGSRVSLYAEAFDFSVTGDLGFDALITLSPPHFIVDFHASVQLKRGSWNLFKVTLDGTLEGPLPLRLAAKATFEILWFSFSVHFDYTLADGSPGQVAPSIRLEDEVKKALAEPANWTTRAGLGHGVTLRNLPGHTTPVLDPLGQLLVQQQVAPLNTTRLVDTYGGVRVAGPQQFKLAASFDGKAGSTVSGAFAPSRYFHMSDDDKLVAPSFEAMDAGAVLGDDKLTFDTNAIAAAPLQYDEFVLNPVGAQAPPAAPPKPTAYPMPAEALKAQTPTGAAAQAPVRQVGRARFRNPGAGPAATLNAPNWWVMQAYGATAAPAAAAPAAKPTTWSEAKAALAAMPGGDRWQVVAAQDLKA